VRYNGIELVNEMVLLIRGERATGNADSGSPPPEAPVLGSKPSSDLDSPLPQ
jgi:hypothetical protein